MKTTELERELSIAYEGLMAQKKELKKAVKSLASKPGTTVWIGTAKSFAEYQRVCGAIHLAEQVLHIKPVVLEGERE